MQLHLLKDEYKLSHRVDIMTPLLLCHIISVFLLCCCVASPISERDYEESKQNILRTQTTQVDLKNIPQLPINFARPHKDQQQSSLIDSKWPHSSQNQVNMRHLPSNASPISIQNAQSGIMIEGSGDGPIPSRIHKQQTEKFDDTEGGDDDDDDDDDDGDYDERDSLDTGSGLGYDSSNSKKVQPAELIDKNTAKKPILNESSVYHPFRPPTPVSEVINVETSTQRNTYAKSTPTAMPPTSTPPNNNANILHVPSNINVFNFDTKTQNQISSPVKNESSNSLHEILLTTTLPPSTSMKTTISTVSPETVTQSKNTLSISNSLTIRPRLPTSHVVPISASMPQLDTGSSRNKYQDSGSSTILMPNSSTTSDNNYDYEEEGEDEEPEESDSNFEDNEFTPSQGDVYNKTTPFNHTQNLRPSTTVRPTLTTSETTTTTTTAKSTNFNSQPTKPTLISSPLNTPASTMIINSISSSNRLPSNTLSTTPSRKESIIPLGDNLDDAINEYDDEDEDDDDEDDEEENEDSDYEDPVSERTIPELYQPPSTTLSPTTTTFRPTQKPSTITSTTTSTINDDDDDDDDEEDEDDDEDDENDKLDRHTNSKGTVSRDNHEQVFTTTLTSSSTLTNLPVTMRPPVMREADQQKTRTSVQILTSTEPSTTYLNTVEPTVMTTVFPLFSPTKRSNEINYMTTPRTRMTTAITKAPDVPLYNNEDDADLTKQLYDKALQVYYATNRAIHAALEVVWPSTFEINSSTFEPLIAQPLLFMLTLGAAVIGLVLTMMLIVYIVSYQIQPRDDISIYM